MKNKEALSVLKWEEIQIVKEEKARFRGEKIVLTVHLLEHA